MSPSYNDLSHSPAIEPNAAGGTLKPLTAEERESFFDAVARNRGGAMRLTIIGWFCSAVVALVVAVLFAPIVFAIGILAFDLVNLVHPIPDPVKAAIGHFANGARTARAVPVSSWIEMGALLATPGLLFMGLVIGALHRALNGSEALSGKTILSREPDRRELAEQRLVNVVTELSLAAAMPVPAIRISSAPVANALVIGEDPEHCTLIVTQPLLDCLNREALQGAIAHLIGSIADGDLAIGMRSVIHALLFDIVGHLGDGASFLASLRLLVTCALLPQRIDAAALIAKIEQWHAAHRQPELSIARPGAKSGGQLSLLWAGPVVLPGLIAGLTAGFLVKPFLTLAWRRRKLMADATAVRLTRDADALATALQQLNGRGAEFAHPFANRGVPQSAAGWVEYFAKNPQQAARAQSQLARATRALESMPAALRNKPQYANLLNRGLAQRELILSALEETTSIPAVAAALAAHPPAEGEIQDDAEQGQGALPAYAGHLALLTSSEPKPLLDSLVSSFPSIDKRLRALAKIGAQVQRAARPLPLGIRVLGAVFVSVFGLMMGLVAVGMVYVSAALSGMFTVIPTLLIHALLRWIGGLIHS